jgi:hypothetical protein
MLGDAGPVRRDAGLQLTWLGDPQLAAAEVRANAARGFKAVSFPELPSKLDLPSLHRKHWDPFLSACEETGTVICLHTGSCSWVPAPSPDAPFEVYPTLFPAGSLVAATDWLWSGACHRSLGLKIAMSEGGIGWVAMLADRADYGHLGPEVVAKVAAANAAELFGVPLPPALGAGEDRQPSAASISR